MTLNVILGNTIWGPLFVYFYDGPWVVGSAICGFAAEFAVFLLYTRALLSRDTIYRRLFAANVASYVAGIVVMAFLPLEIRKVSLSENALGFVIAYVITLPIEFRMVQPLLPEKRFLLIRAVTMANFVSYAILFLGYLLWFAGYSLQVARVAISPR